MTPDQKILVQDTFAKVAPQADAAAALFYGRLFEIDPTLKTLFKGDIAEQGQKLMTMLATAVKGLDRPDELLPAVKNLGVRHVGYGVKDEHYDTVAAALLWTLERGLGADFTPDVRDAWVAVYTLLAATMKDAAVATAPLRTVSPAAGAAATIN
jgi:hemoglobin-like flavoprotein